MRTEKHCNAELRSNDFVGNKMRIEVRIRVMNRVTSSERKCTCNAHTLVAYVVECSQPVSTVQGYCDSSRPSRTFSPMDVGVELSAR